jgi:hypothetical protein
MDDERAHRFFTKAPLAAGFHELREFAKKILTL